MHKEDSMSAHTLKDLFIDELKDMYDAEQRITKAFPKLVEAAESEQLSSAFQGHLDQTEERVSRLEEIFEMFDETPTRKSCRAMIGLLEESEELMKEDGAPAVRDAALIAAAQKVEHYEMATYGCLRAWAERLGKDEASQMLQETLDEIGTSTEELVEIAGTIDDVNGAGVPAEDDVELTPPHHIVTADAGDESGSPEPVQSRRSTGHARAQKRR
jgi:ferritin-like metal-binding protein YciE